MDQTENGWTIIDHDAGVLAYEYSFNKQGKANCFAARMEDGKMLVVSPATGMKEPAYADLLSYGEVGAVVAPNGFHHLGQAEWKSRFPDARFFAAPETIHRIDEKNPDAGSFEGINMLPLIVGEDIGVHEVADTKCGETWVWVRTGRGYVYFVSDILANMDKVPALIPRLLFKFTKSAPGYRPFNLAMKFIVKDKAAVLRTLQAEMADKPPSVVVPGHGKILDEPGLADRTNAMISEALGS